MGWVSRPLPPLLLPPPLLLLLRPRKTLSYPRDEALSWMSGARALMNGGGGDLEREAPSPLC